MTAFATHAPARSDRLAEIDGLRAIAMTAVVAMHSHLLPFGWMGVWLFYVISGFVVTSSLMHRAVDSRRRWLADFYSRRAARILPVYFLYIAVGFVFLAVTAGVYPWRALASMAGFYNNFAMMAGIGEFKGWPTGHLWTISVEMQFYIVYGLAFVFAPRRWLIGILASFLVLAPLARAVGGWRLMQTGVPPLDAAYHIYASSFMQFDAFAAGALLALFRDRIAASRREGALFALGLAAAALYACAYVGINVAVRHREGLEIVKDVVSGILFGEGRHIWLYSALALFNAGLVIWTVSGRAPWSGLLRLPLLRRVGETSYGAYIFHAATLSVGHVVAALIPGVRDTEIGLRLAAFVIGLVGAILLAETSYRLLERPVMGWVSRLRKGASASSAPATAPTGAG